MSFKEELYKLAPSWEDLSISKRSSYAGVTLDLSDYTFIVHNATWCPDCERELTELMALCDELGIDRSPKLVLKSYENIEEYKVLKGRGQLEVSCLPTIEVNKNSVVIGKVEETSSPNLLTNLVSIIGN